MANMETPSDRSLAIFTSWSASKTDADFRQMVSRGVLSRTEIARECQFAKSVLDQNPRVKEALRSLEDQLREQQVLPPLAVRGSEVSDGGTGDALPRRPRHSPAVESDHRRLEIELASLKAENDGLKQRLAKYESLHTALVLTGRVPR
jgi:hypothetical protein